MYPKRINGGSKFEEGCTVLLHDLEELDNHLGGRSDDHLTLSTFLSI
jgi:hypothetical protein